MESDSSFDKNKLTSKVKTKFGRLFCHGNLFCGKTSSRQAIFATVTLFCGKTSSRQAIFAKETLFCGKTSSQQDSFATETPFCGKTSSQQAILPREPVLWQDFESVPFWWITWSVQTQCLFQTNFGPIPN